MTEYDDLLDDVLPEPEVEAKRETPPMGRSPKKKQAKSVPASKPDAPAEPARRGMSRLLERTGRCPMYAPKGTTCKTCGKVHPL